MVESFRVVSSPSSTTTRLAGRNRVKLENLRSKLGPEARGLSLIVADSHDRASLDAMTERTRVVLSTVGPYAKHGSELVAACVASQTHYCDLAGETQWIRAIWYTCRWCRFTPPRRDGRG